MGETPDSNIEDLFVRHKRLAIKDKDLEPFAQRLVRLRKERGLSQAELAQRLGIAQPNVSDYERGETQPGFDVLVALAHVLKVSADELMGLQSSPPQPIIKDRQLLQHVLLIERLPKRDKEALLRTIRLYVGRVKLLPGHAPP